MARIGRDQGLEKLGRRLVPSLPPGLGGAGEQVRFAAPPKPFRPPPSAFTEGSAEA